jgi:hypothetical protein
MVECVVAHNPASLQARATTFLNIGTVNTFVEVL